MGRRLDVALPARQEDDAGQASGHAAQEAVDGGLGDLALVDAGPSQQGKDVRYDQPELRGIDTVLELNLEKGGLWALYTIDPPSSVFLEVRARLIRVSDNAVLLDDKVSCVSDERTYLEWAENDGQPLFDEMVACIPRVAEKIVDDFFLVYPLAS